MRNRWLILARGLIRARGVLWCDQVYIVGGKEEEGEKEKAENGFGRFHGTSDKNKNRAEDGFGWMASWNLGLYVVGGFPAMERKMEGKWINRKIS